MPIAVTTVVKILLAVYFQIQDTKYPVCIHIEYFTTIAVTVYDTGCHREIQIVYNTHRQRPCGGLFLTAHTVRRRS